MTKWSMRLFEKVKYDNATSGNFTPMKYSVFKTRKRLHMFKDAQQRQTGSIINISSIIFVKIKTRNKTTKVDCGTAHSVIVC